MQLLVKYFKRNISSKSLIIPGTKKLLPLTPGQRHARLADRSHLQKGGPIQELTLPKKRTGGRNNAGRICTRGRGGGSKKRYRIIDFKRNILDTYSIVQRLEYDPNRSAYIALLKYSDGLLNYIIAPDKIQKGDKIMSSLHKELDIKPGNAMPIKNIPIGEEIHNVEIHPGRGGQLARAAGTYMKVLEKGVKNKYAKVEMMSKEIRLLNQSCLATIGRVSNINHNQIVLGKAGRNRQLGRRPKVRGVAMNPCDHPHGGGEGKSKGGRPSVSKQGKPTKGYRTRKKHHHLNKWRVSRRPPNKNRYKNEIGALKLNKSH